MRRSSGSTSSTHAARSSRATPNACCSAALAAPSPTAGRSRPSDSTSSDASSDAKTAGLRPGRISTLKPSLRRVVRPAATAAATTGSRAEPVRRSENQSESKPSRSSASTNGAKVAVGSRMLCVPSPKPMRTFTGCEATGVDRATVEVYDARGGDWATRRKAVRADDAAAFGRLVPEGELRIDVGCGAGRYLAELGRPVIGLDASVTMLQLAREATPHALLVKGDVEALPFRDRSLSGAWANMTYLHLPRPR